LFCCVDGKGEGPEAVVVGALWVVEDEFAGLGEFVAFGVEFVEEVGVVGYVESGSEVDGVAFLAGASSGTGGVPFSFDGFYVAFPSADGALGLTHCLL